MASGRLLIPSWMPALDSDGNPIAGVKAYFYVNLTTTLAPIYSNEALTTPLTNPVEANSSGRFPAIWADGDVLYSVAIEAPYGPAGVPFSYDNLSVSLGADIATAEAAEAAADDANAALADVLAAIDAATQVGGGAAALAGALAGATAGTAAANAVMAGKADTSAANVTTAFNDTAPFQMGAAAQSRSTSEKIRETGYSVLDFVPSKTTRDQILAGSYTGDMTAFFQAAHDNVPAGERIAIYGKNYIRGQVNITKCHEWSGDWSEIRPTLGNKGWIVLDTATSSPFLCSGIDARGVTFRDVAVFQVHPAAAPGWSPTVYPAVWDCQNMAGEIILDRIYGAGIYKLLNSFNSGRPNITNFRGQIYKTLATVDVCYDVARFEDIHDWVYMSGDTSVLAWCFANKDFFDLYRCDTPFLDRIFSFAGRYGIRCRTSAAGVTDKLRGGILSFESYVNAMRVESNDFSAEITLLDFLGDNTTGTPLTGAKAIVHSGTTGDVSIGLLRSHRTPKGVLDISGGGSAYLIGQAVIDAANQDNDGQPLVSAAGSSSVEFAVAPRIQNSNGATLGAGTVSLQINQVANQVNEPRAFGSVTGADPTLAPVGGDANRALNLTGKGAGGVRINGTAQQLGKLFATTTFSPGSIANGAAADFAVGIAGADNTWIVTAISHTGITAQGWEKDAYFTGAGGTVNGRFVNNTGGALSLTGTLTVVAEKVSA